MAEIVPTVLAAWVVLSVVLFWRLPGRDAALIAMIGGWVFLPIAPFPASVFAQPVGSGGSMHALAVPTALLVNRAAAIGLGCLAGAMICDWNSLRRIRPSPLDLPIVAWCLIPLASALANPGAPGPVSEGLAQSRYLALTWGVPYLMGRAYLVDNESLAKFAHGLVLAGLLTAPLCLAEFVSRPFLYTRVYGSQPYQLEGAARYVLYRPLLFCEHGNQLGMWVATVAVSSVWLWRSGRLRTVLGIPGGMVAAGLVGLCVVCQSMGSVILMGGVLALVFVLRRPTSRPNPVYVGAAAAVVVLIIATAVAEAAGGGGVREQVRDVFAGAGKQSFNWRLARYKEFFPQVMKAPILGWGRANWSATADHTFVNPVNLGLWLLALGMYGAFGLVASTLVLTLPVVEVLKWLPPRSWLNPGCSAVTLAAVLLFINAIDTLVNSEYILPLLAAAGGINSWSSRRYEGG